MTARAGVAEGCLTHCHLCGRECTYEVEPKFGAILAVIEPDIWNVVARNNRVLDVCQRCWMLWPDEWKHFPPVGFGRLPDDEPKPSHIRLADIPDPVAGPR